MSAIALITIILILWWRCLLIYPAVAVESAMGINGAWRQLQGNTWRLGLALVIVAVPYLMVFFALAQLQLFVAEPLDIVSVGRMVFGGIIAINGYIAHFLIAAVAVTVLSLAYRHLTGWPPRLTLPETEGE